MTETIEAIQTQIEQLTTLNNSVISGTTMDDRQVNSFLETLEYALDALYDKSRLLADLHDQTEEWAIREIEQAEDLLHDTLYNLEHNMNEYLESGSILIPLPISSAGKCRLLDGTILPKCTIDKNGIRPSYETAAETPVSSIYIERQCSPIRSTMEQADKQAGRVYYELPQPQEIYETIMLRLPESFTGNFLDCKPVNAEIIAISVVDANGEVINITDRQGFFKAQAMNEFRIKLKAKNYLLNETTTIKESTDDFTLQLSGEKREEADTQVSVEEIEARLIEENIGKTANGKLESYDSFMTNLQKIQERNTYLSEIGSSIIEIPTMASSSTTQATETAYAYLFGTDRIHLQRTTVPDRCGVMYSNIVIDTCEYIEVIAEHEGNGMTLIIVDGGKETIIQPNEKYSPINKILSLKIVLSQADGDLPTVISKLAIKKHGGETLWQ